MKLANLHLTDFHGKLLNGLLFQLGWFLAVLGGDYWALVALVIMVFVHGAFWVRDRREWWLVVTVTVVGSCLDSVWVLLGFLVPDPVLDHSVELGFLQSQSLQPEWLQTRIPLWLVCIWAMFSMTLTHVLSWLSRRYLLAALLGAMAAPLSYWSGAQLSGMAIGVPVGLSLLVIAIGWALLMPIFMMWSQRVVST
ncbi:DUF2878 domain-containing protein [Aestuariicella hydrocarbonica]|uniref:DUF2878 domain-containing protein n=1 Tax=Pseudomaricurvus hydrocarbonicus TaxID=1470433 RepID=A0A9E5MLG9_9GAMM|nr:DUF2878 domain-containing protein [Aestuariicella hydrocarbonica]NHO64493.1 DUF2878 domain-containing protein [Aestuariicella hydrocarbonica]